MLVWGEVGVNYVWLWLIEKCGWEEVSKINSEK